MTQPLTLMSLPAISALPVYSLPPLVKSISLPEYFPLPVDAKAANCLPLNAPLV
ncbi:hypothetical protein D3C87_2163050 [compost metagenome]